MMLADLMRSVSDQVDQKDFQSSGIKVHNFSPNRRDKFTILGIPTILQLRFDLIHLSSQPLIPNPNANPECFVF